MGRGDGHRIAESERVEFGRRHRVIEAFRLVGDDDDRLTTAPQQITDVAVSRSKPFTCIHYQQDTVGLCHRLERLLGHQPLDTLHAGDQTAGVDDDAGVTAASGIAVLAVARQTGFVGDQRVTAFDRFIRTAIERPQQPVTTQTGTTPQNGIVVP